MEITKQEVLRLAALSKLSFNDIEIDGITNDMQSIISFADTINKTQIIDNYKDVHCLTNIFREDAIVPSYSSQDILSNSAEVEDGHFFIAKKRSRSAN